jgi:hypothetical protein
MVAAFRGGTEQGCGDALPTSVRAIRYGAAFKTKNVIRHAQYLLSDLTASTL